MIRQRMQILESGLAACSQRLAKSAQPWRSECRNDNDLQDECDQRDAVRCNPLLDTFCPYQKLSKRNSLFTYGIIVAVGIGIEGTVTFGG